MPEFQFEDYTRRARPIGDELNITIHRSGDFGISESAYAALGRPEMVRLRYDRTKQAIGFQATNRSDPKAFPIRPQQSQTAYVVTGHGFCSYFGIPTGRMRRFIARVINPGLLVILLDEEAEQEPSETEQAEAKATA